MDGRSRSAGPRPEDLLDRAEQGVGVEGLGHVLVGTELAGLAQIPCRRLCREQDHPWARVHQGEALEHTPAVHDGHHHVEEDEVGSLLGDAAQGGLAVTRQQRGVPLGLEVHTQHQQDVGFVVDDEHAGPAVAHRSYAPRTVDAPTGGSEPVPVRAGAVRIGKVNVNAVPWFTSDRTQMRPPMPATRLAVM